MNLISMTDFVLNFKGNTAVSHKAFEFARKSKNYANFLKQPLILGMFVPCDEYGNVLKECQKPDKKDYWSDNDTVFSAELYRHNLNEFETYIKAKERVLFKGFEFVEREDGYSYVLRMKGQNQVWAEMTKISDSFYFRFPQLYTSRVEHLVCSVEIELTESATKGISYENV